MAAPEAVPPATLQPEGSAAAGNFLLDASQAHKQKLDCAMQLIRTVTLDFNNALTSILGHTSLLISKLDPQSPLRSSLVEIEKSAERAAEVVNDLAAFSRQDKEPKGQASGNVNEVLRRTVEVFSESHRKDLQWKCDFQNRPYAAAFDEAKVQQVFVKILENAVQAITGPGAIYISTRNLDLPGGLRDGQIHLEPGAYMVIEIADTGKGIPADLLPRVFEPFFTTKKHLGHRGLGLAWVYGIITNHGGSVTIASDLNKGTSVRVYLPAQKKMVNDAGVASADLTGKETILLIDDEELLLTMGEMVLSSYGYRVLTAGSGEQALEVFSEHAQEINLVITDLVMPQMSGRELIAVLRRLDPALKIICVSGFVRNLPNEESENYLQKPFASHDLLRKVKQVLSTETREP